MKPLPDLSALDTDLEAAAARLDLDRTPRFALPAPLFHRAKAQLALSRRGIKKMIRPENAAAVVAALPAAGERTHCILRGDFVLCDLIPAILAEHGRCRHLQVATLGLSPANANTLARLVETGLVARLTVIVSHYFEQANKATTFLTVSARLKDLARLTVSRCHAKVILIPTDRGQIVIEGSANLRSSDCIEQIVIMNDPELLAWHSAWLTDLAAA